MVAGASEANNVRRAVAEAAAGPGDPAGPERRLRRRGAIRRSVFQAARLAFDGAVVDCDLLDVSPNGARVRLIGPYGAPAVVTLRFADGQSRTSRRRWRRGAEVGPRFCAPDSLAASPGPDDHGRWAGW